MFILFFYTNLKKQTRCITELSSDTKALFLSDTDFSYSSVTHQGLNVFWTQVCKQIEIAQFDEDGMIIKIRKLCSSL